MNDPLGGLSPPEEPRGGPVESAPDRGPAPARPPAISTAVLAALMLAGFAAEGALGGWPTFDDELALLRLGALFTPAVADGDWWRIGSYAFLHIGWVHLVVNLASLVSLMRWIEAAYGPLAAIGLFSASAIAGGALSAGVRLSAGSAGLAAGASGGIFGLLGAWIALWIRLRHRVPRAVFRAQLRAFGLTLVINALIAFQFPVDNFAHGGGLVCGFLLGLLAPLPIDDRRPWHIFGRAALLCSALALAAAEGAAIARAVHPLPRKLAAGPLHAAIPWYLAPYRPGVAVSPGGVGLRAGIGTYEGPPPTLGQVELLGERRFRVWQERPNQGEARDCLEKTELVSEDDDHLVVLVCCAREGCLGSRGAELGRGMAASLQSTR